MIYLMIDCECYMLESSLFKSNKEIIDFIKDIYGLDIKSINKINKGSANIFILNKDKYILKEFQKKYQKEEIEKEIEVINHLKKHGINVPEYINTIDNNYYHIYKDKIIIIQKYIEGYTMENNTGCYEQVIESAETLGKIIKALKTLPIDLPVANIHNINKNMLEEAIKDNNKLISKLDNENEIDNKIKKDLLDKIEIINKLKNKINYNDFNKLTIENSHGDYSVQQFIYEDKKIKAVIDFASAAKLPIVWEIIRSYSYIDKDVENSEFNLNTFKDYVSTFNKYIKLNEYDLKYMSIIYLIQILCSTFGYKQYIENKNEKLLDFAFFRTNLARYLFNNIEKINKKLKEIEE